MTGENFRRSWLCLIAIAALTAPVAAQAGDAWRVQNRLLGESRSPDFPEDGEKSEDMSGMACAPGALPRLCVAVDDETQGAQIVILQQDLLVAGGFIRLIDDTHDEAALELDAEGVAYADGFFYVIGSHGRPRHENAADDEAMSNAKAAATRKLFRFRLSADMVDLETGKFNNGAPTFDKSDALATVLANDPVIGPFTDVPLEKHGLTVEGVAVRGDNLYAALRAPVLDDGSALIARVPLATLFDGAPGDPTAGAATLFRLALGEDAHGDARGIRDLTVAGDAFLLIAGPEQDPKKHAAGDFAVYAWNEGEAVKRLDLPSFGKKTKPEALVVLDQDAATAHALLLFDGPKEGEPTPIDIPLN